MKSFALYALSLLVYIAHPNAARAACTTGTLTVTTPPSAEIVLMLVANVDNVVYPIDLTYNAVSGSANCGITGYINLPGLLWGTSGWGAAPSFPSQYTTGEFGWLGESGSSMTYPGSPTTLGNKPGLGVTSSSLSGVTLPQVGDMTFYQSATDICDSSTYSAWLANCQTSLMATTRVYVEDVSTIAALPVVFQD